MTTIELPKQYEHLEVQRRWYPIWEQRGYFHSEPDPQRRPYCIVIPPPNVTGALHLGHALNNTLQDILIRMRRMQGYNTLWMPGTDHAGIATQAVVERRLLEEEGKTRHDLGREELVRRIWAWKDEYEARILSQLKQMGCSCDWARTRFTLDPVCARAVRWTFFNFFREGLIYRGKRLVNWDTYLQTAVSDDEVFHEPVPGHFWYIRYPVIDPAEDEPRYVVVATTRPETMLGDVAVAVHPDPEAALAKAEEAVRQAKDKSPEQREEALAEIARRRRELLPLLLKLRDMAAAGRKVMLPLQQRPIPLILDTWAKPEMGTGAVKITPGHDPNDYEVGLRQKLPMINILNPDGTLNENAGRYQGLTIAEARRRVVEDLESQGLIEKVEERMIDLAHSDRSKTPIEPRLADQWFVRMDQLAQAAMDAVTDGRVKIIPERYASGYLAWLSEKRDWPVSRQLWWGHRIPIWYAPTVSEEELKRTFAGRDDVAWHWDQESQQFFICSRDEDLPEDAVPGHKLRQEEDVLDTWFSSALWPHSTLGWPEQTPELQYYYPTSTLITSRDIITLWVARMVLTGLHNVGEVPFREVYIHPKILDGYGETMSKSKGNGVDPVDVIEKFGADSLRFALAHLCTETQDIRMPVQFECPHCGKPVPQTRENRTLPRITCPHCKKDFSTQWATRPEDKALPRGLVLSERFEFGRNFCNKLWNAARFVLMNLEGYQAAETSPEQLRLEDRWLLSRLNQVVNQVTTALEQYRYAEAARVLYDYAWDEFCSFYLEMSKYRLAQEEQRGLVQRVLVHALDVLMRLLHPIIPFLTEEVWQQLNRLAPQRGLEHPQAAAESVVVAPWPQADLSLVDQQIEEQFRLFQQVLRAVREIRSRQNIPPKREVPFRVRTSEEVAALLRPMQPYFETMARARPTDWGPDVTPPVPGASVTLPEAEVFVDLAELIDVEAELKRNEKELARLQKLIAGKEKKLANEGFLKNAPAEVVERERESLAQLQSQRQAVQAFLEQLRASRT